MSLLETVTQALLVVSALGAIGYLWHLQGRERWRDLLTDRFIYGIPWGTLVSIVGVVAFYLVAQSGLDHWGEPVTVAFRSWSYSYLPGMLMSGFAHASPDHLVGNLIGTVVLAPLVEYAWSHYPPGGTESHDGTGSDAGAERDASADEYYYPPPADPADDLIAGHDRPAADRDKLAADRDGSRSTTDDRLLARPWFRAFVAFPAAVVVVSLLTSVFALGWSLGFSGTVFAFGGFAVVVLPLSTIVAMLAVGGVGIFYRALTEPILRVTLDSGAPDPPSWAGVNVQAHLLGFLVGVVLGYALLSARDRRPQVGRIFLAALLFGIARQLWLLPLSDGDTFTQYRGIGLILVVALTTLITAVAAASDRPLLPPDSGLATIGTLLCALWLCAAAVIVAIIGFESGWAPAAVVPTAAILTIISAPALLPFLPGDRFGSPVSRRTALLAGLVLVAGVLAIPSAVGNLPGMDDDAVPEGAVAVEDYRVAYAEDASHGRIDSTDGGVIVVSERRDVWLSAVSKQKLAHEGNVTVPLGGVGWRTPITAERSGWEVLGNDSVYAVDLGLRGNRTRSFASSPQLASALIANHTVSLAPTADGFEVSVLRNGTVVDEVPIPDRNGTASAGPIRFAVQPDEDTLALFANANGTRVEIARKETY